MATKSKKPAATPSVAIEDDTVDATLDFAASSAAENLAPAFPGLSLEEFADLSRETIAAITKSNLALAGGLQAMTEEILGYARSSLTAASETATALLGAKTLDEVVQLSTEMTRSSVEALFARSAKLSELGVNVANETLAPLGGRVEATLALFTRSVAA